ncbi:hypothetical protein DAI43_20740 [Achromobacter xylosoxidans]|nr:hypothetical protein DAI43_20740 [Achromobacter xylosoxidans]
MGHLRDWRSWHLHHRRDGALGQVAALIAIQEGLAMLETEVSVICRIRDCGHLGALGHYVLLAAERGHIALVFQRTPPLMALPGYAGRTVGNNPIAFGCPVPGAAPLVFDMACSVAARGHILLAAREGRDIPADWALDGAGQSTTAADAALEGALLPMSGHKGMGLAIMAECLAGALAGARARVAPEGSSHPAQRRSGRTKHFDLAGESATRGLGVVCRLYARMGRGLPPARRRASPSAGSAGCRLRAGGSCRRPAYSRGPGA